MKNICFNLTGFNAIGLGVEQDFDEVKEWFSIAADHGDEDAYEIINEPEHWTECEK